MQPVRGISNIRETCSGVLYISERVRICYILPSLLQSFPPYDENMNLLGCLYFRLLRFMHKAAICFRSRHTSVVSSITQKHKHTSCQIFVHIFHKHNGYCHFYVILSSKLPLLMFTKDHQGQERWFALHFVHLAHKGSLYHSCPRSVTFISYNYWPV